MHHPWAMNTRRYGDDPPTLSDWSLNSVKTSRAIRAQYSPLIPPIAPKQSALFQARRKSPQQIELVGPAALSWDDCVCILEYRDTWGTSVACGEKMFAIGFRNGRITVYDQFTCQERFVLQHKAPHDIYSTTPGTKPKPQMPVRLLAFDSSETKIASASFQSICIWSMRAELLHAFVIQEPCISLAFSMDQRSITGVARSSRVVRWKLYNDQNLLSVPALNIRRLSTGNAGYRDSALPQQAPLMAAISPDQTMLALLYRGRPIYLCSLEMTCC